MDKTTPWFVRAASVIVIISCANGLYLYNEAKNERQEEIAETAKRRRQVEREWCRDKDPIVSYNFWKAKAPPLDTPAYERHLKKVVKAWEDCIDRRLGN